MQAVATIAPFKVNSMQFIKTLARLSFLFFPGIAFSQSSLLPQGNKYKQLINRLEIKSRDSSLMFSHIQPFSRKELVQATEKYYVPGKLIESLGENPMSASDSASKINQIAGTLTHVDLEYMQDAMMNNAEWVAGDKSSFNSRKPWIKTFYKSKSDFFQVDTKDFFLSVNPVLQQLQSFEQDNDERVFLNSKGLTMRGLIAKKIGFDFYLTDNQERLPSFAKQRVDSFHAVPGAGFYKPFKTTAYDYFDARGSIYFNVTRFINIQFGYDKNFIGSGYRSLLWSDYASNNLFLKLNLRVWKLNYQTTFHQLSPQYIRNGDELIPKKYAATHHLSVNATKWLNVGLFESVIFGRLDNFDLSYLNPIIFLRSIEQQNGSPDNANIGFDFKANVAKRLQFYGQLMFDEFVLDEAKSGDGWWGNKFGVQLGAKYIDAFGIKNLDLQGEMNFVRPYTYSHKDSVANYSHYNQPLAHPLGGNFAEAIGIIRYQPHRKWLTELKMIVYRQGVDSGGINYGSNIFEYYTTRPYDYGFKIGTGLKTTCINASAYVAYEVLENLFLEGSYMYRKFSVPDKSTLSKNTSMFTLGVRMNMFRREYDY